MVAYISRLIFPMRRFLVIAALWLGLLGIAEPLLACAMNTPASSCCSTATQAACDHDSDQSIGAGDRDPCCASAPVGEPAAVSIKKGDANPDYQTSGNAHIPLITSPSWHETLAAVTHDARQLQVPDSTQRSGAETYLRTGRLRL